MPNIPTQSIGIIKVGSVKNALGIKQIESYKKGKVRYNVTDFSTGSFYERLVDDTGLEPVTSSTSRRHSPS